MFENETYSVVSYEEMKEANKEAEESAKKYRQAYKNFLITCLCESGFAKKLVRHKKLNIVGILDITEKTYWRPYEIKFFPVKKNGGISAKPKYYGLVHDERFVQDLTEIFELVGDDYAS